MTQAHTHRAHATLAPSAAHRWMHCPGSVRLSAGIEETPSAYAAEGTAAHMLAERCLAGGWDAARFKGWTVDTAQKDGKLTIQQGRQPNGKTVFSVDPEMVDAVQLYLDTVRAIKDASDEFEIEERMDISGLVPGVFGTGDAIAYVERHPESGLRRVSICDLKYGKGVPVEAEGNKQLLTYAIGVVQRYHNRGVDEVELVIVQPRAPHPLGSVRRWTTDIVGLYEHVLALQTAAAEAARPDAPFVTGDHCKFCKAAGICSALRKRVWEIIMKNPETTPYREWPAEVADIELVKGWARRREEFAHSEALRGRMPPGAKLVNKRPTRAWDNPDTAVDALRLAGLSDDDLYETSLRSPAQVEKALPAKERGIIGALASKRSSGTVLAPMSDPRPSVDPNDAMGFDVHEIGD